MCLVLFLPADRQVHTGRGGDRRQAVRQQEEGYYASVMGEKTHSPTRQCSIFMMSGCGIRSCRVFRLCTTISPLFFHKQARANESIVMCQVDRSTTRPSLCVTTISSVRSVAWLRVVFVVLFSKASWVSWVASLIEYS